MGHILSLLTYLLTTSVSGRVPGYPSGTAALVVNAQSIHIFKTRVDQIHSGITRISFDFHAQLGVTGH